MLWHLSDELCIVVCSSEWHNFTKTKEPGRECDDDEHVMCALHKARRGKVDASPSFSLPCMITGCKFFCVRTHILRVTSSHLASRLKQRNYGATTIWSLRCHPSNTNTGRDAKLSLPNRSRGFCHPPWVWANKIFATRHVITFCLSHGAKKSSLLSRKSKWKFYRIIRQNDDYTHNATHSEEVQSRNSISDDDSSSVCLPPSIETKEADKGPRTRSFFASFYIIISAGRKRPNKPCASSGKKPKLGHYI